MEEVRTKKGDRVIAFCFEGAFVVACRSFLRVAY